jgi:hypothetical protein
VFRGEDPTRIAWTSTSLGSIRGPAASAGGADPWQAQFSGGRLHEPEWFEPYDVTRLTASIAFDGTVGARPLSATLAWGENREYTRSEASPSATCSKAISASPSRCRSTRESKK